MYNLFFTPFIENPYLAKALLTCCFLSFSFAFLGLILILRRMSLIGDSLSHAILPGVAIGFATAGLSLWAMTIGGIITGLIIVLLSTFITRLTSQKEDASFASFYIMSTAIGIIIVTLKGNDAELVHLLFGDISMISDSALLLAGATVTFTLAVLAIIYRPLLMECFDPIFMRSGHKRGGFYHYIFLVLAVINLVAGFRALGTLMAVGLMLLPVMAARFWAIKMENILGLSIVFSVISSYAGILLSHHLNISSGPAIVLSAGSLYIISIFTGTTESLRKKIFKEKHLKA